MKLQKSLSTYATLMTSLSSMLGSGWLFSSFIAAQLAGPTLSIIAWPIGGLLIAFIALCFSELSSSLPITGSIARYGQISHGPIVGFIISWLAWLSLVAVAPTEAQATIMYFSKYYKDIAYNQNELLLMTSKGQIIAILLLFLFTIINFFGIKLISKLNNIFGVWKIIVPLITSLTLLMYQHDTTHFAQNYNEDTYNGLFEAISTVVVFSYLGFKESTEFGEEIKNPQTAIPIAVLGSVFFAVIFYMFIQITFVVSVPDEWISEGWHHMHLNGLSPFINLSLSLGLAYLAKLIIVDAAITPFSSVLIYTATTGRVTYAMSMNHYIPKYFSKLNNYGIPFHAIFLNFIMGCLLFYPLPSWQILLKFQTIAMIVAYLIGPITLVLFRNTSPTIKRPFMLPFKHIIPIITCFICTTIIYWSGYETIQLLNYGILMGVCVFSVIQFVNAHNIVTLKCIKQSFWIISFLLGLQCIAFFGQFGQGKHLLHSGIDYACLACLSTICFYIALKWHKPADAINLEIQKIL